MLKISRLNLIRSTQPTRQFFWRSKTEEKVAANESVKESIEDQEIVQPIKSRASRSENLIRIVNLDQTETLSSDSFLDNYKSTPNYQSKYSLDKVYPNSSLDFTKNVQPPKSDEKFTGYIPIEQLKLSFNRSSGPGGQNVNKVNSKVTVQIDLENADWISKSTKVKLKEIHKNSLSKDGKWIIRSDKTRSQHLNIADCMDKIRCYITEAEKPPKQMSAETLEKIKEGVEKANSARLRKKRHKQMIKNMMSADY